MTVSARLKAFCKYSDITITAFCQTLGITGNYLNKGQVSVATLQKVAAAYPKLNLDWVLTGRGKMYIAAADLQEQYWSERYSILLDDFSKMQNNYIKTLEELRDIRIAETEIDKAHKEPYGKWVIIVNNHKKEK